MQALLVAMPYISAGMTIFSAIGQFTQGKAEEKAAKQQAAMGIASAEQKVALDKANAENDALQRVKKLRQTIGEQAAFGASATGIGSGTIGTLIENSTSEYGRDVGISDFNLRSSSSAYLTSARADANVLRFRGAQAAQSGMFKALDTLGTYAMRTAERGKVPGSK
jgi:hypothetical protein